MARRSRWSGVVLALAMMLAAATARAQLVANGADILANSYTDGPQAVAAISIAPNGELVIVWQSDGQDGNDNGIFLRQFEADGVPLSGDIPVNTFTAGSQQNPAIDMDSDGNFVVVWESQPVNVGAVIGRRFDATGQAIGGEFQVNVVADEDQDEPDVAVRDDGSFVVVWGGDGPNGNGVFARRYDSTGTAVGTAFEVPAVTAGSQVRPAVAMDHDGDFVVVWRGDDGATNDKIWIRRFTSAGTAVGLEFRVGASTAAFQENPDVAIAPDSSFIVTWEQDNGDGSGDGIAGRRFTASASPLATEFQINSYTTGNQQNPSIAVEVDGDFLIAWNSEQPPPNQLDVFAQRFRASGTREGGEFHVNLGVAYSQYRPAVASDPSGSAMIVVWEGDGLLDNSGVFAQRYTSLSVDVDGNRILDPLTDGILFLRYLFGFRDDALTAGAVGNGCTRCTADPIEAFLDSIL